MPPGTLQRVTTTPRPTDEEVRVLATVATGMTVEAAGRHLGISARTIRRHVRKVCGRIGVDTTVEAVAWAARHGFV